MISVVNILVSLLPVFIFLLVLIFIDSFQLIKKSAVFKAILAGMLSAFFSFLINIYFLNNLSFDVIQYSRYGAPIIEELIKAAYPIYLIKRKKIGFLVDASIYGFTVGAGFAFIENIDYLRNVENSNILLWIIRGFGTAVMHGGTTAIFTLLTKNILDRNVSEKFYYYFYGLLSAIVIHSFFNHFLFGPVFTTMMQLIILPTLVMVIFRHSDKALREWLELGLDLDVWLLESINTGKISDTKMGHYLESLKNTFPGEVLVDMLCMLRIHLELAIRAKGFLLMREAGFEIKLDADVKAKFEELKYLQKSIGKTGQLAMSPMLLNSSRDLWQLYFIDEKS